MQHDKQLARFAKAMGHPTRIAILRFLSVQDSCFFGDIQKELLQHSKTTIFQHLTILKDAGLIQSKISSPKVRLCINPENWALIQELFNELQRGYSKKC